MSKIKKCDSAGLGTPNKTIRTTLLFLLVITFAVTSKATPYTYSPTPADLNDLDHHRAYTWRIDNIDLGTSTIAGASLTFTNIANWDMNPNTLFIHLLDTAKNAGVASFIDAPSDQAPVTDIHDDFEGARYAANPLVADGTSNTWLASQSFNMTPTTYTFNFTPAELVILQAYIANSHDIAFGIDPDCHFFNDGVVFRISVPDTGSTAALLSLALVSIALARRKSWI